MRKLPFIAILLVFVVSHSVIDVQPGRAQAGSAYDLIAAVNALRASNGLGPLETNALLMGAAQSHSDYQASIGQVTHYGPGGSRPKDRAAAAGYGGGATFFLSENIQGGTNLSAQEAVNIWTQDAPHWNTMMGSNYMDIGAGVAVSGDFVYYTIDVGYIAGSSGNQQPAATKPAGTAGPTPLPVFAVQTATPNPDGSIIHIVQSGQSLYTIAEAYGVTVNELLRLNNRQINQPLYIGDQIIVLAAYTITPTSDATLTFTPRPPTSTPRPTRTATLVPPTRTASPTPAPTATPTPQPLLGGDTIGNGLLGAVAVLLIAGSLFVGIGTAMKRGSRRHPNA